MKKILDDIHTTADLKSFTREELHLLCQELRDELVTTLSGVGGHFASSLGVVEITVALHSVFNTPEDRIVWDVGHQAYIHKILTNRRERMSSIRKLGGLSGFPSRFESEYDTFGVGHAGTSISAAIGMLEASSHEYPNSKERSVIAVIGDGGMTAGMAFEALNHAGQLHRKLIVILNDNEMSIAPNVGAMSWMFSRAVTGKLSTYARKNFKSLVEKGVIPHSFYKALDRAEDATQGFLSTPAMLFGSFGFRYIGPIDGHDLDQVMDALERAKDQDGPVLIHALTLKGKGYEPAEEDSIKYHFVSPFDVDSGKFHSNQKTPKKNFSQVFGETITEICKVDPRVVGVTAAMPDGTGLKVLAKEMPERCFDVGIAEQHAVTFSAGLACEGMKPFCAIYSTFLQRAYDQVIHDVCIQKLPVIFALDRGGLVGADGATHHGVFDFAYLRALPNIVVAAPRNELELRDLMYTAVAYDDGAFAFRYPRGEVLGSDLSVAPKIVPIGKGYILRRPQLALKSQVLFLSLGITSNFAFEAANRLASEQNIETTVIHSLFLKPLDQELLQAEIKNHDLIITIEDHAISGGFGSAVLEFMADQDLLRNKKVIRLGVPDRFVEQGTQAELYKECGFDVDSIIHKTLENIPSPSLSSPQAMLRKVASIR
jgi:1-deoxy-D-xylulose-5-phosphate synthase